MGLGNLFRLLNDSRVTERLKNTSLLALFIFFLFPIFPNAVGAISLGIFIVFFMLTHPRRNPLMRERGRFLIIVGFFLFLTLSLLWSSDILAGLKELKIEIAFLIITYVFWYYEILNSNKIIDLLKLTFIFSIFLYFFLWTNYQIEGVSLFQVNHLRHIPLNSYNYIESVIQLFKMKYSYFGYISEWGYFRFGKTPELFIHHTYISFGIFLAIIFLVQFLFQTKNWYYKLLLIILLLFFSWFLFQLPSKINILIFALCVLFLGFTKLPAKLWLFTIIGFSSLVFFKFDLGKKLGEINFVQKEPNNRDNSFVIDYQRYQIYKTSVEILKTSPLIGIGIGDVESRLNKLVVRNSKYEGPIPINSIILNTHSYYFFCLLSTGILGLLLFFCFILYSIYLGWINKGYEFIFFIIMFSINCIFESFLSRNWGVFLFLIGWIIFISEMRIALNYRKNING